MYQGSFFSMDREENFWYYFAISLRRRRKPMASSTGKAERFLQLTQTQIAIAKSCGLTFAPRKGKLVCNQAPELGRISPRQADILRSQVWPRSHGVVHKSRRSSDAKPATVHINLRGGTTCPCGWYQDKVKEGACVCANPSCQRTLFVKPVSEYVPPVYQRASYSSYY